MPNAKVRGVVSSACGSWVGAPALRAPPPRRLAPIIGHLRPSGPAQGEDDPPSSHHQGLPCSRVNGPPGDRPRNWLITIGDLKALTPLVDSWEGPAEVNRRRRLSSPGPRKNRHLPWWSCARFTILRRVLRRRAKSSTSYGLKRVLPPPWGAVWTCGPVCRCMRGVPGPLAVGLGKRKLHPGGLAMRASVPRLTISVAIPPPHVAGLTLTRGPSMLVLVRYPARDQNPDPVGPCDHASVGGKTLSWGAGLRPPACPYQFRWRGAVRGPRVKVAPLLCAFLFPAPQAHFGGIARRWAVSSGKVSILPRPGLFPPPPTGAFPARPPRLFCGMAVLFALPAGRSTKPKCRKRRAQPKRRNKRRNLCGRGKGKGKRGKLSSS